MTNEIYQGTISYDDPIQEHLDFDIKNDSFQNEKLKIEHLITHTLGLKRGNSSIYRKYTKYLRKFKLDYLPGINWGHNNLAVGLVGHIVAQKSNSTFDSLLCKRLLAPLKMTNTHANAQLAPLTNRMQCPNKKRRLRD